MCCVEEKKPLRKGADGRDAELLAVARKLPNRSCSVHMCATRVFIERGVIDEAGAK